jgi:hypothetical protein
MFVAGFGWQLAATITQATAAARRAILIFIIIRFLSVLGLLFCRGHGLVVKA